MKKNLYAKCALGLILCLLTACDSGEEPGTNDDFSHTHIDPIGNLEGFYEVSDISNNNITLGYERISLNGEATNLRVDEESCSEAIPHYYTHQSGNTFNIEVESGIAGTAHYVHEDTVMTVFWNNTELELQKIPGYAILTVMQHYKECE